MAAMVAQQVSAWALMRLQAMPASRSVYSSARICTALPIDERCVGAESACACAAVFQSDTAEVTGLRGLHALTHVMTEMSFNGMVIRHHSPVYHIW